MIRYHYVHLDGSYYCLAKRHPLEIKQGAPGTPGDHILLKVILKPIKAMIRTLSQKLSNIMRFENFEIIRFCHTLTHKFCHN